MFFVLLLRELFKGGKTVVDDSGVKDVVIHGRESNKRPVAGFMSRQLLGGARVNGRYTAADVCPYIVNGNSLQNLHNRTFMFEIQCCVEDVAKYMAQSEVFVAAQIPWVLLVPKLTGIELRLVGRGHGISVASRLSVPDTLCVLKGHVCTTSCQNLMSIMRVMPGRPQLVRARRRTNKKVEGPIDIETPCLINPSEALVNKQLRQIAVEASYLRYRRKLHTGELCDTEFPPDAIKEKDAHRILTGIGQAMLPDNFCEDGCAVCGKLTPVTELSPLSEHHHFLYLLEPVSKGITRKQRFHLSDPIEDLKGPVLAEDCTNLCVKCEECLRCGKVPHNALVKHQWLGKVPPELQDLRYAEQVMIARVRHNRCVMRVNSGRVRMHANAILFAQPALKVYLKLPPSKEELSEVLAFVFTGSAAPTQEDFDRTPMLVRRDKVAIALEWLKLNHEDYADLEISEENLLSYRLKDIPVIVDYRRTNAESSDSIPTEARSVFDSNEEHGTSKGLCSFAVHGLTSTEYSTASMSAIKAIALQHLTGDGKMLGIGRNDEPESIYKNPALYPGMFPWLFPYGKGGIGHSSHKYILSDASRKCDLLLYHDKRFQRDTYFPMIAFNHEQMKGSSIGSKVLTARSNFNSIAARLSRIDHTIVGCIADRMRNGEIVRPETSQEKDCFELMNDLDGIGAHVMGFATSKKHMRNEIWSVSAFMNAPTWFMTMAWSDSSHPLALYYAATDTIYRPELKSSDERNLLMSQNPVAAARFFHYMVDVFLKEILCWNREEKGLFGHTDAYYGTVEQQGRLTLHLHILVWVRNALSPQEIREKIMAQDSVFVKKMIDYLESSSQGHFNNGNLNEVRTNVSLKQQSKMDPSLIPGKSTYQNPTQTLPSIPPSLCDIDDCDASCHRCIAMKCWFEEFEDEVDDILLRSNIHSCSQAVPDQEYEEAKKDWRNKKKHAKLKGFSHERRGCLTATGVCKARFPREVFQESFVDDDGHLNVKHLEALMNKISKILTYFSRSNTDVTSLLSGTAVKAVISYVSDYISKIGLKSYQAFASIFDVFDRHHQNMSPDSEGLEASRNLMRQMVNSMSSKMEIGSPMASLYLLGNPDHYSSHTFVMFFWKTYVLHVRRWWLLQIYDGPFDDITIQEDMVHIERREGNIVASSVIDDYKYRPAMYESVSLYEWTQCHLKKARTKKEREAFELELEEHLQYVEEVNQCEDGGSDYESDHMSDFLVEDDESGENDVQPELSDYISNISDVSDWSYDDPDEVIIDIEMKKTNTSNVLWHPFLPEHPHFKTHKTRCDFTRIHCIIPNFIGGAIPRSDKGDREFYCLTILTLFKPWRHPQDLKDELSTWDQVFVDYQFSPRERELMKNFNVRYECNDARDDHYAAMKKKMSEAQYGFSTHYDNPLLGNRDKMQNEMEYELYPDNDENFIDDIDTYEIGKKMNKILKDSEDMRQTLQACRWLNKAVDGLVPLNMEPLHVPYKTRSNWAKVVKEARKVYLSNKLADMPEPAFSPSFGQFQVTLNTVEILSSDYFHPRQHIDTDMNAEIVQCTVAKYSLNTEQARAFQIVADHAALNSKLENGSSLKMYLAGMGGTGKSNVFKAIIHYFKLRKEDYRYIVVGPTGSVAALLLGSTYHSVFKVPRDASKKSKNHDDVDGIQNENSMLAGVNERIQGVEYILLDEVSMVSCNDLQTLSCQAAKARNKPDIEFGGMSVILAGDFAQLPPTTGPPLYDGRVGLRTNNAATMYGQNSVLGKILWHQFNTVVILRENMRQRTQSPEDTKLRTALENMRYAACTAEDIEFLRSRIASDRPGHPRLDSRKFRNVSVITSWNIHKDVINELGAARFAQDTGQSLTHFYSSDTLNSRQPDKKRWNHCEQAFFKGIGPKLRQQLWTAPPACTNDHVPGCLSLCVGMPVMLRSNDATELCITKGQEAIVRGWNDTVGSQGQRILETLFVELINPARDVELPDLPKNVIPLGRKSMDITCLLPNDTVLTVTREQCLVLLNFAMTDYASQGKSRDRNCVHLNNCKNHMSIYVALSRGFTAENTVILQAFDTSKITKGISGYLRQEFREIELLDEITRLQFEGCLPKEVSGIYRGQLLHAYKQWNKGECDPDHFHPAIRYNPVLDGIDNERPVYDNWHLNGLEKEKEKEKVALHSVVQQKRKGVEHTGERPLKRGASSFTPFVNQSTGSVANINAEDEDICNVKKPISIQVRCDPVQISQQHAVGSSYSTLYNGPLGLVWDADNYSCGYDSFFTPLIEGCKGYWGQWSTSFSKLNPLLALWATEMGNNCSAETARDQVRRILHAIDPVKFPIGPRLLKLDDLLIALSNRVVYGSASTVCDLCEYTENRRMDTFLMFSTIHRTESIQAVYPDTISTSEWLWNHLYGLSGRKCPQCSIGLRRHTNIIDIPSLLVFDVAYDMLDIEEDLSLVVNDVEKHWSLRGLIYHSERDKHFTCMVIDQLGRAWYHDGISTGRYTIFLGYFAFLSREEIHQRGTYKLCTASYMIN